MRVILLQKVRNLGILGHVTTVKPGYGRYLITQGLATRATSKNLEDFEHQKEAFEHKAAEVLAQAQGRAAQLAELKLKLAARASEEGKLYGSLGARELADAITAAGVTAAKSEVRLPNGPIRTIGEHEIEIHLHSDVITIVRVEIIPER